MTCHHKKAIKVMMIVMHILILQDASTRRWWSKAKEKIKNLYSKHLISQTYNFISTNKSRKQFIQTKKWNQTNIYLLCQHNKITKKFYNNLIKSLQSWKKLWLCQEIRKLFALILTDQNTLMIIWSMKLNYHKNKLIISWK